MATTMLLMGNEKNLEGLRRIRMGPLKFGGKFYLYGSNQAERSSYFRPEN